MARTIKRNFFYNLLLQVSKVLFPLVTAPYIARVLDPEGVGIANFVNTYSSYFALFAVLGIPLYGIREIAKKQNDLKASEEFVSQMISIELFSTLLVSIFYFLWDWKADRPAFWWKFRAGNDKGTGSYSFYCRCSRRV